MKTKNSTIIILILILIPMLIVVISFFSMNVYASSDYKKKYSGYGNSLSSSELHNITRLSSGSDDSPSITFLVHGQGGNASHWSNNSRNNDYTFQEEEDSLVDLLMNCSQQNECELYWAKFNYNGTFYLIDLSLSDSDNYYQDFSDGDNLVYLDHMENVSKHSIIIFESYNSCDYHRVVYDELHKLIDNISYDYLVLTGRLPKVNLISHSRGGITSLMYASGYQENGKIINSTGHYVDDEYIYDDVYFDDTSIIINDHPFNVDSLYSIGTPYKGTKWDTLFGGISHLLVSDFFNNESASNILDEDIQNELLYCWNNAVLINDNLNLHAIAGVFDPSFISGFLAEEAMTISNYADLQSYILKVESFLTVINLYIDQIDEILLSIEQSIDDFLESNIIHIIVKGRLIEFLVSTSSISAVNLARNALGVFSQNINYVRSVFSNLSTYDNESLLVLVVDEIIYPLMNFIETFNDVVGFFTLNSDFNVLGNLGDLFIDRQSQLAVDFSNTITYTKTFRYNNLMIANQNGEYRVLSTDRNFEYLKCEDEPGIPHNLETHDLEIIQYICDSITLEVPSTVYSFLIENNKATIYNASIPNYFDVIIEDGKLKIKNNGYSFDYWLDLSYGIYNYDISELASNSFENFNVISKIILPDSLRIIDDYAFYGCYNLSYIRYGENLEKIGISSFEECSLLSSIYIPYSVQFIDDSAFENCSNLSEVIIERDISTITRIGVDVFDGCSDSLQIKVPKDRLAEYKNKLNWSDYKSRIISDSNDYTIININCISDEFFVVPINTKEKKLYKLNVECGRIYVFSFLGGKGCLYDSYMDKLYSRVDSISYYLNSGTYYFDIEHDDLLDDSDINVNITTLYECGFDVNSGYNNVTNHIHLDSDNIYKCKLILYNTLGEGYFNFKIIEKDINNNEYFNNLIYLYKDSDRTNLINSIGNNINNQTANDIDNFVCYLNGNGYYYLDIYLDTNYLNELSIDITIFNDSINIDLLDSEYDIEIEKEVVDTNLNDCYLKKINLNKAMRVRLLFDYDSNDNFYACLIKVNSNGLNTILLYDNINNISSNDYYDLSHGTYYLGYLNKNSLNNISISVERIITEYSTSKLIADPDIYSLHGSETRYNNGTYQGTTLTIGFTRFLFINNVLNVPSDSVQNYYLYSSNESVATISQFGTILGLSPGTTKIMAVYKNDPSIVYVKEFTVLDETRTTDLVIPNIDSIGYAESGQLYSISLTDTNSFFPQLSLYNWSVVNSTNNYHYSISIWGTFSMNGADVITIEGRSTINSKLVIRLVLTVN